MEKVLVTGAAGFIGSHLCEALLAKDIEVIGIDCFTDYYPRAIKEKNLSHFKNNPKFKFIEGDLLKNPYVKQPYYSYHNVVLTIFFGTFAKSTT